MIITARQIQEKCQEQNVDLYMTFVDLTKAFDTVSREGLWKTMANYKLTTIGAFPNLKFFIEDFLWQAFIRHSGNMACPF